ncbi:VanZ family protein [Paenibacillus assamensis]|uniref:VanZ family protein n=1 Tax=Paenibacillus assamensis TaxID=311244 RepID=UPI0004085E08|nr:VanZ family protein [Paenibacillus assamensis]
MQAYIKPLMDAALFFPFIALALTLPFLVVQYRRYGYVNKLRAAVLYSMLLYMISAYFLVILPLPSSTDNCIREGAFWTYSQLVPFTFASEILNQTQVNFSQPSTYMLLVKEKAFLQAIFNVFLTIPLGVYARYYFRRTAFQTGCIAFGVACLFEITQITGLFGIFDCPYRLFDVDDFFLNTTGGLLGYFLTPLLTFFLPRSEKLDEDVELSQMTVGYVRRLVAFLIDTVVYTIVTGIFTFGIGLFLHRSLINQGMDTVLAWILYALTSIVGVLIYFVIVPTMTNGRTIGKMVTRIHIVDDRLQAEQQGRTITAKALFHRYSLLYTIIIGYNYVFGFIFSFTDLPPIILMSALFLYFGIGGLLVLHLIVNFFTRDKRLFYEKWSHTRNVITERKDSTS